MSKEMHQTKAMVHLFFLCGNKLMKSCFLDMIESSTKKKPRKLKRSLSFPRPLFYNLMLSKLLFNYTEIFFSYTTCWANPII